MGLNADGGLRLYGAGDKLIKSFPLSTCLSFFIACGGTRFCYFPFYGLDKHKRFVYCAEREPSIKNYISQKSREKAGMAQAAKKCFPLRLSKGVTG